ncbi:MAG: alpha/beta hydrolase [Muribaculaceae bacterium]|nr:alpha/beta hydrolase [Muribaculaceae bacterium]
MKAKIILTALLSLSTTIVNSQNMNNPNTNTSLAPVEKLELTQNWDKVFPESDKVDHSKVVFVNRYGVTLAADMYKPKGATGKLPAIAVSGPFGAVKEQSSGLYAQQLAERGFLTIAFDPSFTGESGGTPRRVASPDINVEDFSAAVDYLMNREDVDSGKVGILGICGWGGIAIQAAINDPRIKATVASTMYDMTRVNACGYFDSENTAGQRNAKRAAMAAQRTIDFRNGSYMRAGGVVDPLPEDAPQFVKDYYAYYKTPRGYHVRSGNSTDGWNATSNLPFINFKFFGYADELESAVLIVHGDKAHSYYFGKDTFARLKGDNKQMLTVKGASHCDLYDRLDIIPMDEIAAFYVENLNK